MWKELFVVSSGNNSIKYSPTILSPQYIITISCSFLFSIGHLWVQKSVINQVTNYSHSQLFELVLKSFYNNALLLIHSAWSEVIFSSWPGILSIFPGIFSCFCQYKLVTLYSCLIVKLSPLKLDFEILFSISSWAIILTKGLEAMGKWWRHLASRCKVTLQAKSFKQGRRSLISQRSAGCFFWPATLSWGLGFRFPETPNTPSNISYFYFF